MFRDIPEFVLPIATGDTVRLSWWTQGGVPAAFDPAIGVSAKPIRRYARRYMERLTDQLSEHVPLQFRWVRDNRPADIRFKVTNQPIRLQDYTPPAGSKIAGYMQPGGRTFDVILGRPPVPDRVYRFTAMHELGHALGLSHPGSGGFDGAYSTTQTVMSYNRAGAQWPLRYRQADLRRLQEIWERQRQPQDPLTGAGVITVLPLA